MQRMSPRGRPREKPPTGYVTVRQAANYFGVSEQAIRNRIREGTLPSKKVRRERTGERRYYVQESALVDEATADEIPMSDRDAALAAKDETIAELRQRVASLEQHLETLESLFKAALERGVERPAPLDENKDVGVDKRKAPRARSSHPVDGEKLRELRLQRRLTGQQLANKAGLSMGQISRIEQNRLRGVRAKTLLKLAKALEVDDEELLAD